jgi:hypothetical protein
LRDRCLYHLPSRWLHGSGDGAHLSAQLAFHVGAKGHGCRIAGWIELSGKADCETDPGGFEAARRPSKWLTPGKLLVARSFVGATFGFELCLARGSNASTLYGAVAGFIVLMIGIYLAIVILLVRSETGSALRELRLAGA